MGRHGARGDAGPRQLITDWGRAVRAFLVLSSRLTEDEWASTKIDWVAGEIGLRYLLQSRIIEWWFHGEDIREGAGLEENPQHWPGLPRERPGDPHAALVARAGRAVVPRPEHPGRSRGRRAEGTWHWGLEPRTSPPEEKKPDAFINGRGTAFALVAGRRVAADDYLDDGDLVVGGDEALAIAVLEFLRAFVE